AHLPFERRHVDVGPERRLREAERHVADDVVLLAPEERVILDADDDVEIARRTAAAAALTFPSELQAGAGVDAGGNLDAQRMRFSEHPLAAALRTRVRDRAPAPVTLGAHLGDAEEALL